MSRRTDRLRPDEADRIRAQRAAGHLDEDDPDVRRLVAQANRTTVRADLWGRAPGARRATFGTLLVVGCSVLLFIGGLLLEFLTHP